MKISELARQTGVTVPTIKYYVREGLLAPGRQISATQAEYSDAHVERLRLVRALVEVGGLSLTVVGELLDAVDRATAAGRSEETGTSDARTATAEENDSGAGDARTATAKQGDTGAGDARTATAEQEDADAGEARAMIGEAIAGAHRALVPQPPRGMTPIAGVVPPEPVRARAAMEALGWEVEPDSPGLQQLETALAGLDDVGLPAGEGRVELYGKVALEMAEAEVGSVPTRSAAEAVRYVVLGTVMYEPVLIALRRLAHQHVFRATTPPAGD
jgi:DNA-binding transcriptional MerR regulator